MRLAPPLKRPLWQTWYDFLAAKNTEAAWTFMNYGFVPLDPGGHSPLTLLDGDEPERLCIQLYHHVAGAVDLRGRDVLEVGCGRGGGSRAIFRYLGPRAVVGVDFSANAIALCRRHRSRGLAFAAGDAEALPFAAESFDAVVNVESSHCYPSMERFLREVRRVLRPGGHFLFADLRGRDAVEVLRGELRTAGLEVRAERVITANVVAAMEEDSARKLALIRAKISWPLRGPFQHFAGLKGTNVYEALRSGQAQYLSFVCVRSPNA
jgi:SAM-dependent methyltransferase